jgi:hypothetical protein
LLGGSVALLLAFAPAFGVAALNRLAIQIDGDAYESPQFGYVVEWTDAWGALDRHVVSDEDGMDQMLLTNNHGRVWVTGYPGDGDPDDALETAIERHTGTANEVEMIADDADAGIPSVELTADRDHLLIEVQALDDATVVVTLLAREEDYEDALAAARDGITLNGAPVLSGEQASEPEPTEEPTEEPEPTEAPEPTGEPDTGLEDDAWTNDAFGFAMAWDEDVWNASAIDANTVTFSSETGVFTVWAAGRYEGNAATCLEGEATHYATDDPLVSDWAPAVDDDGETIAGDAEGIAWGVFTLNYANPGGEEPRVDYLECRTLVADEAVLLILASARPREYPAHIDAVLEITNAIEMPDDIPELDPVDPPLPDLEATPPEGTEAATEEPAPTEEGADVLVIDADTYESIGFGFSLEVPADWTMVSSEITPGTETVVLSNGTSTVTILATTAYTGDLEGCITFVRDRVEAEQGIDLRLQSTSSGEAFRGSDDRSAFALFAYTGANGAAWAHYVHCQHIVAGESVLIVSQDVPQAEYQEQRPARAAILNAIDIP